ncbi:hypothetical protein VKT23_005542 [Stygiomarasmius scandens]|uniref:Anaphase-promoting complex subunit 4-like WD40 domain-containing protein n=1 Tax=Marasmiellus scandens TaxID=2682957 RepID=A0ABR1JR15_9AGAR
MDAESFSSYGVVQLATPCRFIPSACCPDKDLVLLVTRAGGRDRMGLWTLSGTKTWEVDPSPSSERIVSCAWSPDGQSIAVAQHPPYLALYSLQDGREERSIPLSFNNGAITGVWWFRHEKVVEDHPVPDIFRRNDIIHAPASIPLSQHALQSTADIICYRLGLSPENNSSTRLNDYVPSSHYCEQADWALFRMGLRNCPEFIGKPENHSREENELKDFLHKIFNYVTSQGKAKLFAPTFDYGPSMYNKVTGNSYWRVGVITLSKQASGPSLWQNRDINVLGISSQPLVDQWYLVGLWDSAAVLQLFRMSFVNEMSVLGAVRELIQWGIPFLTLKPSANYPTKAHQRPEVGVGLGFRSRGHRFDESELAAYETAKKDLLSTSVGRLALMKGGIIWRLAKDLVPVKSVVKGPPPSVRTSGVSFGKLKGSFLCDEVLEESEEDIIVGLYKVESGISGQNADLSWWPKPSAWSVGNRNFGYWTPDCEKFYQDRLREIRLGKARPRSATEWHQTLERSALSVSAFHGSLDHAAMQLLDNQLDSYWVQ